MLDMETVISVNESFVAATTPSIRQEIVDKGCEVCRKEYSHWVFDARLKFGPWAFMCEECFKTKAIGVGTGFGQVYSATTLKQVTAPISQEDDSDA